MEHCAASTAAQPWICANGQICPIAPEPPRSATLTAPVTDTPTMTRRRSREIAPGEIAIGVIIGRASEFFDFFVYGIASVLVFPAVFFPFDDRLEGTLYSFVDLLVRLHRAPDRLDRLHGDPTPLWARGTN